MEMLVVCVCAYLCLDGQTNHVYFFDYDFLIDVGISILHILVTGDWAVTAQAATLCIWTILQLQQVMYELFRHVVCIDTSGSRRN